jgi:hypothetical protein
MWRRLRSLVCPEHSERFKAARENVLDSCSFLNGCEHFAHDGNLFRFARHSAYKRSLNSIHSPITQHINILLIDIDN